MLFQREGRDRSYFICNAVEHLSMPIKTILSIISMENTVLKFPCLAYAQKHDREWPSILGYKCSSVYHIITRN